MIFSPPLAYNSRQQEAKPRVCVYYNDNNNNFICSCAQLHDLSYKQSLETEVTTGFLSQSPAFFVCEVWWDLNQTETEVLQYEIKSDLGVSRKFF